VILGSIKAELRTLLHPRLPLGVPLCLSVTLAGVDLRLDDDELACLPAE
jgi:hypothetical protein